MKAILKHLEIELSSNENGQSLELMFINNQDGSPRWIWNAESTKPLFLKFYTVNSLKSKMFSWVLQLIFLLKIQKLCFRTSTVYVKKVSPRMYLEINPFKSNWALFTGTVGPNNKLIAYKVKNGKGFFYKIAPNNQVNDLLQNEVHAQYKLDIFRIKSFDYPISNHVARNIVKLSDVSLNSRADQFSLAHSLALSEMYTHTQRSINLTELPEYQKTQNLLSNLLIKKDSRIPVGLLKKIKILLEKQGNKKIQVAMSHGDFTPWNSFIEDDRIAIYDWELSRTHMPIGHDAFHFIMQQGILVSHQSWKQIKSQIFDLISPQQFKLWMNSDDPGSKNIQDYLTLYLIFNTVYYLDIYSNQAKWHQQINWLIKVWSSAISDLLQSDSNHRQILIMDVFDFLKTKPYGTIKFPEFAPENLSEYSDIDMCIHQKNAQSLIQFLKQHPMASKINIASYSYMKTVQIILKDQSSLSLDLIWEFKRKSLYMLDFKHIISRCYENRFGVKKIKQIDLTRYIGLFYLLNGQSVPSKFKAYEMLLSQSPFSLDRLLYRHFAFNDDVQKELLQYLNQVKINSGVSKLISQINYLKDCFAKFIFSKSLMITFSGVDGAGKSTVIENVKHHIEKVLRKPVVVLRHRPSVLPILSAWVKGKDQAEKDAVNSLPRQGTNNKFMSSLLRFGYYYVDYVLGQFYVFFKYQAKGYVVLYDRYYFDFINDSKRSNIQLPKNIIRLGYNFLFTPDLNFFLYADPEVVLSRKKELDVATIKSLTSDYLNLFENLDQGQKNTYFKIENLQLDQTINQIIHQTSNKLLLAS